MFTNQIGNMENDEYMEEANPYMTENTPMMPNYYAGGGIVENDQTSPLLALMGQNEPSQKNNKANASNNPYPSLAEMIRQQGEGGDTILAHINPIEAEMLSVLSGGGSTNPVTGLPQFRFKLGNFWKDPFKATKKWAKKGGVSNLLTYGPLGALGIEMLPKGAKKWVTSGTNKYVLPAAASMLGNTILPGLGGVIGGSLGGAVGGIHKGKIGEGALRGGMIGATLPSAASLAGSGANALGMKGLGQTLTNYGEQNSIMKALGLSNMFGGSGGISGVSAGDGASYIANEVPVSDVVKREAEEWGKQQATRSLGDKFMSGLGDFVSSPSNLLTAAVVGGSLMNRPKPPREKSPEELAAERKRYEMALMLTPQEQAAKEAADLATEQSRRRIARNKFLPEERFNIEPLYVKTNSPEDYKKKGRWLEYYNNPEFTGNPIMMKEGGMAKPRISYEMEEFNYPSGLGFYISGHTSGQDDKIPAMLSDGEYVIPADVLAHLGDGNNNAGAKKLDEMVGKIRTSKGMKNTLPPKAKSLASYIGV